MKKILCILFALCLVLTLSACKKQPPVTENAGGENNSAESGDSLVVGGNAENDNVDTTPFDEPASGTTTPDGSGSGNTGSGSSGNSGSSNQTTPPSTGNGGDSGNQESGGNTGGSQGGQEDGGNSGNQGSNTNTNDDKLEIQDKDTSGGGWGSMQK